jgi:photosystem II stability/assembly factor-like uncharacterized protein
MFEHLDDPDELQPGSRELNRVVARANGIRTRRRAVGVVTLCCLLLATSVALFVRRPSGPLPSANSNFEFNLSKSPLPLGAAVPTTALLDVQFADAEHGFGLALHRSEVVLVASSDGGTSWQVRNNRLPEGLGSDNDYPGQFEFVADTGYLWGEVTATNSPLWISQDAGATWSQAPLGPYVYDVSAIGLNVWALSGNCPAVTFTPGCSVDVEESVDAGTTWTSLGSPNVSSTAKTGVRSIELARITRSRAYVLSYAEAGNSSNGWQIDFTDDGGASWVSSAAPCVGPYLLGAELAASSTDDLWLLCGSQGTSGEQSKELYRSDDAGRTWGLTASATGLGTPPPPSVPPNPLPLGGYITPFTVGHRNLAVASSTTAWLFPARSGLYKTDDGGTSWTPVSDLTAAGLDAGGQGNISFLSATQGWICAYGVGLWQTVDGIHWHSLGVN